LCGRGVWFGIAVDFKWSSRIQHSAYADGGLLMPSAWGGGWVGSNQAERISKVRTTDNP
jgi:hypothetical protein